MNTPQYTHSNINKALGFFHFWTLQKNLTNHSAKKEKQTNKQKKPQGFLREMVILESMQEVDKMILQ